jgi:hypothetical protein
MTFETPILARELDVYRNGVHSVLILSPPETFTHTPGFRLGALAGFTALLRDSVRLCNQTR